MIASIVYLLCVMTSLACLVLLWRQYRRSRQALLLWSGLAFLLFAAANALLFIDLVLVPGYDISMVRNLTTLGGVVVLLYGLIRSDS